MERYRLVVSGRSLYSGHMDDVRYVWLRVREMLSYRERVSAKIERV